MIAQHKSLLLVGVQLICLLILSCASLRDNWSLTGTIIVAASVGVILWAIMAMRRSRLRITPNPAANAILITTGPYRYIRHPMYTGLLLGSIGLVSNHLSISRALILVVLAADVYIKLLWEEKMLTAQFPGYVNYQLRTKKLVPYIF